MAKSKCPNCQATHSCSCKLKVASDGKECCTVCIAAYEASLRAARQSKAYPKK